jgi:hypothetical protein
VSFRDEHIAVRRGDDISRLRETRLGGIARDARRANRHQQRAVGAVLEDLLTLPVFALRVRHPHVPLPVDVKSVREDERAAAPALDDRAGRREAEDRRLLAPRARILEAAMDNVDVAVRPLFGADDRAPRKDQRAAAPSSRRGDRDSADR